MNQAKLFLQEITRHIHPGPGQRHSLTLDLTGNLVLTLALGSEFLNIVLEEKDLSREPGEVVGEIVRLFGEMEIGDRWMDQGIG